VAGVPADDDLNVGVVIDLPFQGLLSQIAIDLSDDQDEPLDRTDAGEGPQAPGEDSPTGERKEDLALLRTEP
jgi:hypothetical protein